MPNKDGLPNGTKLHFVDQTNRAVFEAIEKYDMASGDWIAFRFRLVERALDARPSWICTASGLTQAGYSMWKSVGRYPQVPQVMKYCKTMGLGLDWIYYGRVAGIPADKRDAILARLDHEPDEYANPMRELIELDMAAARAEAMRDAA